MINKLTIALLTAQLAHGVTVRRHDGDATPTSSSLSTKCTSKTLASSAMLSVAAAQVANESPSTTIVYTTQYTTVYPTHTASGIGAPAPPQTSDAGMKTTTVFVTKTKEAPCAAPPNCKGMASGLVQTPAATMTSNHANAPNHGVPSGSYGYGPVPSSAVTQATSSSPVYTPAPAQNSAVVYAPPYVASSSAYGYGQVYPPAPVVSAAAISNSADTPAPAQSSAPVYAPPYVAPTGSYGYGPASSVAIPSSPAYVAPPVAPSSADMPYGPAVVYTTEYTTIYPTQKSVTSSVPPIAAPSSDGTAQRFGSASPYPTQPWVVISSSAALNYGPAMPTPSPPAPLLSMYTSSGVVHYGSSIPTISRPEPPVFCSQLAASASSVAPLSSSMLQFGSGLPAPSFTSSAILKTPLATTVVPASTPIQQYPWGDAPVHGPAPHDSSSIAYANASTMTNWPTYPTTTVASSPIANTNATSSKKFCTARSSSNSTSSTLLVTALSSALAYPTVSAPVPYPSSVVTVSSKVSYAAPSSGFVYPTASAPVPYPTSNGTAIATHPSSLHIASPTPSSNTTTVATASAVLPSFKYGPASTSIPDWSLSSAVYTDLTSLSGDPLAGRTSLTLTTPPGYAATKLPPILSGLLGYNSVSATPVPAPTASTTVQSASPVVAPTSKSQPTPIISGFFNYLTASTLVPSAPSAITPTSTAQPAPILSGFFNYLTAMRPSSSTAPAVIIQPINTTPTSAPAVLIIPVTPTGALKRSFTTARAILGEREGINTNSGDNDNGDDSNDDGDNNSDMNYYPSSALPTTTLATTIFTESLPSPTPPPEELETSFAPNPTDAPELSSTDAAPTPSMDPRCPYPYPGINCNPNKTLVTSTTSTTTTKTVKPSESAKCPYPGQKC